MAEVLVLAEHSGGSVRKVTTELLTAARRLGSPSVVWAGPASDEATAKLLAQLVAAVSPAAVLIAGSAEGKEVAGRLAVKTGSGVLADAVDVTAGQDGAALVSQA